MRTTLNIDPKLLERVVVITGEKSRSKAVSKALEDYLYWDAVRGLRELAGKVDLVDNLEELESMEIEESERLGTLMGEG